MTDKYIPASKLLALQRWDKYKNLDPRGEFINFADLRAIIEQHKHAVPTQEELEQEIYAATGLFIPFVVMEWILKRYYPSPDIIAELVKALESFDPYDDFAALYQLKADIDIDALLAKAKEMMR